MHFLHMEIIIDNCHWKNNFKMRLYINYKRLYLEQHGDLLDFHELSNVLCVSTSKYQKVIVGF